MPAVQTTYANSQATAYNGMVADARLTDILSRECEDATLGFGLAVIKGTADDQVKVGAAGTYVGVTVKDVTLPPPASSANVDKYIAGQTCAVITRGAVWVVAPATITAGQPAYYTAAGVITNVSSGNTLIAGATFETSGASTTLVRLALR